ncbi:MAG: hypothetical protein FJ197_08860 [Gammaproteobacteria bacterium]|nr:hypothetical protein [Gammaproteobacteria bacterium]
METISNGDLRLPGRRLAIAVLLALAVAGCGGEVVVRQTFPAALVQSLPLRAGLLLDETFVGYVHREERKGDRDWSIALGDANREWIRSLADRLFAATQDVTSVANARNEMPTVDLVLQPAIDTVEFSVPRQSATDHYAVWIRYNFSVYKPDGELVTRWRVSAYGQSGDEGLSAAEALERAAYIAMRDAAATVATGFARQKKIKTAFLQSSLDETVEQSD